jgi:hypothetical protein
MTITLTREEAQQVHDALLYFEGDISDVMFAALTTLRARLAQPEREWQGLTDEDAGAVSDEFLEGVLWAEAKLKEKNT